MQKIVIGLIGVKGSGKDTAAAHLVAEHQFTRVAFGDAVKDEVAEAFNIPRPSLDDQGSKETPCLELALVHCKDKAFVAVMLAQPSSDSTDSGRDAGWSEVVDRNEARALSDPTDYRMACARSPREILQYWGTEYRRAQDVNYWIKRAVTQATQHMRVVLTDVRMPNERDAVTELGGYLARINRPEVEQQQREERAAGGTAAHSSETAMLTTVPDFSLLNVEGDLDVLRNSVDWMMRQVERIQKTCAAKDQEAEAQTA